jgi:integrase
MSDRVVVHDGRGRVFLRNGTYYAQIRIGPNKYIDRSLKTKDLAVAVKAAERLCYEVEFKQQHAIPINVLTFSNVLDEYVAFRTKQHEQGRTSDHMLRQIKRVSKFWHAYAGKKLITKINDSVLRDYVEWRTEYYENIAEVDRPKNYKLYPADKTLQWEITYAKTVIKWAQSKGYRGKEPLPTFTFSPKTKRVRPAFEPDEFRKLWRALTQWIKDCKDERHLHTRLLLRDYVALLVYSGMRVGEANNLQVRDVTQFRDNTGRINYSFIVRGKTDEREVVPRIQLVKHLERLMQRHENLAPTSWLYAMKGGTQIITLIDQFDKVLELGGIKRNRAGIKYSLYSLRHTYAVNALRDDVSVYTISSNMGTGIPMIKQYYGKQATPRSMATTLGGPVEYKIIDGKKVAVGAHADEESMRRQLDITAGMAAAEMKDIIGPELRSALGGATTAKDENKAKPAATKIAKRRLTPRSDAKNAGPRKR